MTENEPKGLEESLERLEKIVSELESGEHTLEQSLSKFEEGVGLGKHCREILDKADMRVRRLIDVDENGEAVTGEFDEERDGS